MRTRRRGFRTGLVLAALALAAACGDATSTDARSDGDLHEASPAQSREVEPHGGSGELEAPPPVTVHYSDESVELHAWTYCYRMGCADGVPPPNPADVGSPEEVLVDFPLDGWRFQATFTPTGEECGRVQTVHLDPTGDGRFVLTPAGHAGSYDVTLFGKGDGDLFVTFRWTTPVDGPLPEPKARLAVLADHDGRVDSYGVELAVSNLARTPKRAEATITVRAAEGDELSFEAVPAGGRCFPEGSLYWDGPDDQGLAAARLGEPPFTYEVELVLDGSRYRATATWPDDEIVGNEPSVSLDFSPELPAPE